MCAQNHLNSILQKFEQETKAIFGNRLDSIVLFGSYARGDFDEESDIDILILADMSSDELASYRGHIDALCGDLLWEYGIVVSAIEKDIETYNKYSNVLPFYKNIEQEGVKIA